MRVFDSFDEAEACERAADSQMKSEDRIRIVLELRSRRHPDATQQRLARICRVIELEQG